MKRLAGSPWYKRARRRMLLSGLCLAGLTVLGSGCAQFRPSAAIHGTTSDTEPAIIPAAYHPVERLPAVTPDMLVISATPPASPAPNLPAPATAAPVLPIGLDTVFRLAEEQNAQVGVARARLQEAYAEKDLAGWRWLPDFYVGTAYYRHEGGIANEDGTLTNSSFGSMFAGGEITGHFDVKDVAFQQVNAQREVWQQKGELSKITSQTFLEASDTYIDWLTARSGETVIRGFQARLRDLLGRAQKVAAVVSGTAVEVSRIRAELDAEDQALLKIQAQARAAQAKLLYLLGLDPCSTLVSIDQELIPLNLIDATPPTCDLVAQAWRTGPGIQEMQGLLTTIQQGIERAQGPGKFMPVFELHLAEGGFGTGPGDTMDWDNRFDLGLQARWNLTQLATVSQRRRIAQAKVQQANLAYQDLQGKLAAGVQASREDILSGKIQIGHARQQIQDASQAFDLSNRRVKAGVQGSSYTEALLALSAYGRAERSYLEIVNAYDKAQLQLMILLGPAATRACIQSAPSTLPPIVSHGQ
jgi:outer membrane protein TolC